MLISFFDSQRVVHKEFEPDGQTVNQQYYHEVLERLKKKGSSCPARDCRHLDYTLCHTVISVKEFLTKEVIPVVSQTTHPPDLSPCFPETQILLHGSSFWKCGQHPKGHDRPDEGTST